VISQLTSVMLEDVRGGYEHETGRDDDDADAGHEAQAEAGRFLAQ
jgi:hypothetical protein